MVQAGIITPGIYTDININTQRSGRLANTHKVLFITNDDGDSDMPVGIYDKAAADSAFGPNSEAGRMITAAIKTNRIVDVQCLGKSQAR
jgi:phage tail sheath gpL-like